MIILRAILGGNCESQTASSYIPSSETFQMLVNTPQKKLFPMIAPLI